MLHPNFATGESRHFVTSFASTVAVAEVKLTFK